jgi:hypothetical protein
MPRACGVQVHQRHVLLAWNRFAATRWESCTDAHECIYTCTRIHRRVRILQVYQTSKCLAPRRGCRHTLLLQQPTPWHQTRAQGATLLRRTTPLNPPRKGTCLGSHGTCSLRGWPRCPSTHARRTKCLRHLLAPPAAVHRMHTLTMAATRRQLQQAPGIDAQDALRCTQTKAGLATGRADATAGDGCTLARISRLATTQ